MAKKLRVTLSIEVVTQDGLGDKILEEETFVSSLPTTREVRAVFRVAMRKFDRLQKEAVR